ncbi:hypothetical protein B0H66DRAFT_90130 [Apodospora peruviana]|uniref:Uncharacterized protein n=1 Tax=Apodospora peruviana TaxID=516989 RepID=A0AAE0IV63_9PEZI|nr:hypothetical protein B0H66DRAFT_90130 [Apodospora peruviana]
MILRFPFLPCPVLSCPTAHYAVFVVLVSFPSAAQTGHRASAGRPSVLQATAVPFGLSFSEQMTGETVCVRNTLRNFGISTTYRAHQDYLSPKPLCNSRHRFPQSHVTGIENHTVFLHTEKPESDSTNHCPCGSRFSG